MTFLSPWRLLFLVAALALVGGYVALQRRRRQTAVRFTSVELLASVAPRRPGWQRHVAPFVLLLTIVALVLAFAQPARVTRTARQQATVMLDIDTSGSMVAADVSPSRLSAAQAAAKSFANGLPSGIKLGVVTFSETARVLVSPTTDRSTVLAAIDGVRAGGGTATADAVRLAIDAVDTTPVGADGKRSPSAIVLMSDGAPTIGRGGVDPVTAVIDAATQAAQDNVPINTIAYGTSSGTVRIGGETVAVPSDPATMAEIASRSGGKTFTATSANELRSVYKAIGRTVGYDVHRSDITVWFAGIALALGMLAAAAALIWSQRIT